MHTHPTSFFFFFNDTATTEIYTLSLHDALPICRRTAPAPPRAHRRTYAAAPRRGPGNPRRSAPDVRVRTRSEEHTSELQSHLNLVCRLLLEKKKKMNIAYFMNITKKHRASQQRR